MRNDAATRCAAAMDRSAAAMAPPQEIPVAPSTEGPVEVPSMPFRPKVQAPLHEPAPAPPKEVSRGALMAMAKEARKAADKMSLSSKEECDLSARPKEARADVDVPPFPPHLRDMADELKQQISDLQSTFGKSRALVSASPDAESDELHREADRAVAKAREMMERAPHVQAPPVGSVPRPVQAHDLSPRLPLPVSPVHVEAQSRIGVQRPRDHSIGQTAPTLPTYKCDPGMPKSSPRASPRASPFSARQDLHSTAPNVTRMSPAHMHLQHTSPGPGTARGGRGEASLGGPSPVLASRGGRVSPSSSPVTRDRQGRVQPSTVPNQTYQYSQPQAVSGRRMPGYAWMGQSQQSGLRY